MEHLSSTQITLYLQCPRRYRFMYVDEIKPSFKSAAIAFGSAIHSAIAYLAEEKKRGNGFNLAKLISTFRADWEAQKCDELRFKEGENEGEFLDKGISLLKLVFEESKDWRIKAAELPFSVPILDPSTGEEIIPVPLTGFIDLVLEPHVIIEIKTGIRKWSEENIQNNIQVSLYAYAYRTLFGQEPQVYFKILLRQRTPRIDNLVASRSQEDIEWSINLMKEVYEGIKSGIFFPNPGWYCPDCEYENLCKGKKGGKPC